MMTLAGCLPGCDARTRGALFSVLVPLTLGLTVTQASSLALLSLAGPGPGLTLSEGEATDAPEASCVGCHFETPGDEAGSGASGQAARLAHARLAAAAGLREAGTALRGPGTGK